MNKKAFSLVSILFCLCLISSLMLVSLKSYVKIDDEIHYYLLDYLQVKSSSLKNHQDNYFKDNIHFNSKANVELAKTIDFKNHKLIIHLGNGYLSYE